MTEPVSADVELVLAFLNTMDAEVGSDVFDEPGGWPAWVAEHGPGDPGDHGTARASRDALRAAVTDGTGELPPVAVTVRLAAGVPALDADHAVGRVLAAAVRLAATGEWNRIKICPAHDCRWAFYDRSRNRSRTWCAMQVCGNRQKARQFRQRARGAADRGGKEVDAAVASRR